MNSLSRFFRTIKILGGLFVFFIIFVIVRGGILAQIHENTKAKKTKVYYTAFNKFFKGTVIKIKRRTPIKKGGLRDACYRLHLIESSSRYYRPSHKNSEYFCVIDFPYAEVMAKDFGDVQIGDTCYFNGTTDCLWTKVANKKWRVQRPEIGRYAFLNKPYTAIPQYDSIQLMWRKYFYPKMEASGISQMNYYWQYKCNKKTYNENVVNYNQFFYNFSTWESTVQPLIIARRKQPHFYMIKVAEYIVPLDLDSLMQRYGGESIIWIKDRKKHKYFINRQILRLSDAKKYLKFIKKKFATTPQENLEIRKIKNKDSINWFDNEIDEVAMQLEPDVQVISKSDSLLNYVWILFIIFTFINVLVQRILVADELKTNPDFAKGFKQYVLGLLFFFNVWLVLIGIGLSTGWVNSIFDFMYVRYNPMIIISNVYLIIVLFSISRWIFVRNGAKILAKLRHYPSGLFSPIHTEDGIILLWGIYVLFGIVFIFARLFFL